MDVRLATRQDVPALMALEERYFIGNLDDSEQAHGFISMLHSRQWFTRAVDDGGIHVAIAEDEVLSGFIAVTEPPARSAPDLPTIIAAMLDLADTVSFEGRPIAAQRYAIRGPVLIDRAVRGQGLYSAFNSAASRAYAHRYDIGVIFVAADNPLSLHTTTTKLGAQPLAQFEVGTKAYHFLAFRF